MNPKIEEIVASLRGCALNNGLCSKCVVTGETDCNCRSELILIAADLIEQLQQELIDERYRHDRYADFCVAQGEELSVLKKEYMAMLEGEDDWYDDRTEQMELTDEQRKLVDFIQKKTTEFAKANLLSVHEPQTMSGEPIQFVKYGPLPKVPKEDAHGSND